MAEKEAAIFIVDVGASMGDCHNGRVETDLEFGLQYIWQKIAETLALNRKGTNTGILALRHDETKNPMGSDEYYENIAVLKELGPIELPHLKELQAKIKPSSTDFGDALSAVVVAIDMIEKFTTLKTGKLGKYKRTIYLITNGDGPMDGSDLDPIVAKINEMDILLKIVGIDFDDPEFGVKEEDKSLQKKNNEDILKELIEKCKNEDSMYGTASRAIDSLSIPKVKETRLYTAGYQGKLSLGDYNTYPDTALYIDVHRYFKTHKATPVSASSFTDKSNGEASGQSSHTIGGDTDMTDAPDLTAVKNLRTYLVDDSAATGGKKSIPFDELSKGYMYGSTAVPINESEENVTKLETMQSLEIIGFVPWDKYETYLNMGECSLTVAQSVNQKARLAFSSFVHALHELQSYAVARIVVKNDKEPQIILMAPLIEQEIEALYDVPLPFAEDVRTYRFPPLDRVITTSGAIMKKHRNLPDENLIKTMDEFVDSMDLSEFGKDDDGNATEYMQVDDTYNPAIHRINQTICTRAVQPEKSIQPPADILMRFSKPPEELVNKSASKLKKLVEAADVKTVEPKVKGRHGRPERIKPLSGLDVKMLLASKPRAKITMENSIPEFKQALETADKEEHVNQSVDQLAAIIRKMVKEHIPHDRVVENVKVMREQMIAFEVPDLYNNFIRDFKKRLDDGELMDGLGDDKRELLFRLRRAGLTLLTGEETFNRTEVTQQEAAEFWSSGQGLPSRPKSSGGP